MTDSPQGPQHKPLFHPGVLVKCKAGPHTPHLWKQLHQPRTLLLVVAWGMGGVIQGTYQGDRSEGRQSYRVERNRGADQGAGHGAGQGVSGSGSDSQGQGHEADRSTAGGSEPEAPSLTEQQDVAVTERLEVGDELGQAAELVQAVGHQDQLLVEAAGLEGGAQDTACA